MIPGRRGRERKQKEVVEEEGGGKRRRRKKEEEEEERGALLPECFESPVVREQTLLHLRA
jgi:hypothetical protein